MPTECSEPDGQKVWNGRTQHDWMLMAEGRCPWCGQELYPEKGRSG